MKQEALYPHIATPTAKAGVAAYYARPRPWNRPPRRRRTAAPPSTWTATRRGWRPHTETQAANRCVRRAVNGGKPQI